jgi:hypothetical protein
MKKRLLLTLYDRSGLGAYMPVNYKGHELAVEEHMEKFAELIIDEVYSFLLDPSEDDEPWHSRAEVKKHFGVEL